MTDVSLDQDQQEVVTDYNGARCVIAGPGSGKTTTMVALIRQLLKDGVRPHEIRAVTFTKEMATTLSKRIGVEGIASTFHSLGYLIVSKSSEHKNVEPELRHRLMMKLIRKWKVEYKDLDTFISKMRRENISPEEAEDTEYDWGLIKAYHDYETTRCNEGWIDFDSMIADAVTLLEQPEVRAKWQYRYLIVDEAQDTDNAQWRMMQLMSEKYGNITVVGDPNQAIYGFRGAHPENLVNFQKWFPDGRYFYLGRNYRSTATLVKFVRENLPRGTSQELQKRMIAARVDAGVPTDLKMYWLDEYDAMSALALATRDPLNSVILARTNRMVGLLERLCAEHSIRYHLMGKTGFWKQNEVRKAIEALRPYAASHVEAALNLALPVLESKYSVDDRTEQDNDALENLKTFRKIGCDGKFKTAGEYITYANKMLHRRNDPKGVSISTVHQAKGGEWKNVYIIGASIKGFPHPKGDPTEEERIYFVAISRATDYVRISFAGTPSPYLRKYITDEILDKLREKAEEVTRLEQQAKLF